MTERPEDIAQCAAAMSIGEAEDPVLDAEALQVAQTEGSEENVVQTERGPLDDIAVAGIGTGWTPDGVSPQPESSPNLLGARPVNK